MAFAPVNVGIGSFDHRIVPISLLGCSAQPLYQTLLIEVILTTLDSNVNHLGLGKDAFKRVLLSMHHGLSPKTLLGGLSLCG